MMISNNFAHFSFSATSHPLNLYISAASPLLIFLFLSSTTHPLYLLLLEMIFAFHSQKHCSNQRESGFFHRFYALQSRDRLCIYTYMRVKSMFRCHHSSQTLFVNQRYSPHRFVRSYLFVLQDLILLQVADSGTPAIFKFNVFKISFIVSY